MAHHSDSIRLGEKLGYAGGDFASNLFWKTMELYLLFFYTEVFGLSPAAAGTMLLVTRVGDALADPLIGAAADRTRSRHGRFRPYLLWMSVPLAVTAVLTFTTPELGSGGKLVWAYVTYGLMMLAYSAINIPYSALLGVITPNGQERVSLASLKFVGAFTGGIVVAKSTINLAEWLGNGSAARGWQLTMGIYGVVAVGLFALTFATTRERVTPPPGQRASFRDDVADLFGNGPWRILLWMGLLVILTIALRNGTAAYYLKYYVKRPDLISNFLTVGMIAYMIGAACTPLVTRFLGKRKAFVVLMLAFTVLSAALFVIPATQIGALFVVHALASLVLGPKSPLVWSMYADTADYSEWRNGRRATGFVFAAATFSVKAGGAMAAAIAGWLLSSLGYVANQAQNQSTERGILLMVSLLPAVFALLAVATMRFYRLDEGAMAAIRNRLDRRRAWEAALVPAAAGAGTNLPRRAP